MLNWVLQKQKFYSHQYYPGDGTDSNAVPHLETLIWLHSSNLAAFSIKRCEEHINNFVEGSYFYIITKLAKYAANVMLQFPIQIMKFLGHSENILVKMKNVGRKKATVFVKYASSCLTLYCKKNLPTWKGFISLSYLE
jgi:hypothetical protein